MIALSVLLLVGVQAVWAQIPGKPVPFAPDVVSTAAEEYRVSFTPDGKTAYFARGEAFFPTSREATIYVTRLKKGAWSTPEVAPFSGEYSDIDPFVSPDGSRLFFSSIRPVDGTPRDDLELWMVEKTATGWGEPVHLGAVNSPEDDLYPSVSGDGTLYFGSFRAGSGGGVDIYYARLNNGSYGEAENLKEVNTEFWEFNPAISEDGQTLVYTGLDYPQGEGLGDLYVSSWDKGWSKGRPLGAGVNTAADEYHPSLSPDGGTLYFVRRSGTGDIYQVPLKR